MSHCVHTKAVLHLVVEGVGGRFRSGRVEEKKVMSPDVTCTCFAATGTPPSQWQDAILKKIKRKCVLQNKGSRKPIGPCGHSGLAVTAPRRAFTLATVKFQCTSTR